MSWTVIQQGARMMLIAACLALVSGKLLLANPVMTEQVRAELGSVVTTIQPGASFWTVLHLRMQDGWHTYWQNPGDSGLATEVRWVLPEGFSVGDIVWPYPHRLPFGSLMNYGYENTVALLMQLTAPAELAPGQVVALRAQASWIACAEICVPEAATLDLKLPVQASEPQPEARWLAMMQEVQPALPKPAPWPVVFSGDPHTLTLEINAPALATMRPADVTFFPLAYGIIDHAAPQQVHITPQGLHLTLQRGTFDTTGLTRIEGVLVLREKQDSTSPVQAFTIGAVPVKAS